MTKIIRSKNTYVGIYLAGLALGNYSIFHYMIMNTSKENRGAFTFIRNTALTFTAI
jgi:hypothetical protein